MPTPSSDPSDAETVVAALVDGLRPKHRELNSQCGRALRALGGRVLPLLAAATTDPQTKRAHRRRIVEVCVLIDEDQPIDEQVGYLLAGALVSLLKIGDPQLQDKAVAAMRRIRPSLIDRVVLAAIDARRRPRVCVRLLDAAGEVGATPSVSRYFDLLSLAVVGSPGIQTAAWRLIFRMRLEGHYPSGAD